MSKETGHFDVCDELNQVMSYTCAANVCLNRAALLACTSTSTEQKMCKVKFEMIPISESYASICDNLCH